jgi:hypothetical protein
VAFFGFLLAGLGSSALSPIFFSIAGRLSNGRNAIAVAQLSFMNNNNLYLKNYSGLGCAVDLNNDCIAFGRKRHVCIGLLWKDWYNCSKQLNLKIYTLQQIQSL